MRSTGWPVKFELISEGKIELEAAGRPRWSPVVCLALPDAYAEKLLSNSDRWPDRQLLARDLIDLGMLRFKVGRIPDEAWSKAERAYGAAVLRDLRKALDAFIDDAAFQERSFTGLSVSARDEVLEGVGLLLSELQGR